MKCSATKPTAAKRAALPLTLLMLATVSGLLNAKTSIEFEVVDRYPHDRGSSTQGLEIHGSTIYESTGQYGKSSVRHYSLDFPADITLHQLPADRFGEGLTLLNDKLYQLSWRSGDVFVYRPSDLTLLEQFSITTDGWGLTNNGSELIYSDGSEKLFFIDTTTHKVTRTLTVSLRGKPVEFINELEWVDGLIFANILPTDTIVVIDPSTGVVVASLDIGKLYPQRMRRGFQNMANGIAWDRRTREVLVTGKNWPWMYRLKLLNYPLRNH